jgi:hypothetical protein
MFAAAAVSCAAAHMPGATRAGRDRGQVPVPGIVALPAPVTDPAKYDRGYPLSANKHPSHDTHIAAQNKNQTR